MRLIHDGYRGLAVLAGLNSDRLFFGGAIVAAIAMSGFLATR